MQLIPLFINLSAPLHQKLHLAGKQPACSDNDEDSKHTNPLTLVPDIIDLLVVALFIDAFLRLS
jgi:hypothetical protein